MEVVNERKLWEILVPTISNEGKPFRTRYHKVWDAKIREISKGLTILAPAKGQWLCKQGKLYVERMIPVRLTATKEEMERIADHTANYYSQKAVMYYEISSNVVIKNYEN